MILIAASVQMFVQRYESQIRFPVVLVAAILSLVVQGCTHLTQVESLTGKSRTETYRTWVREDPNAQKLLVFVHGFNSSKDLAWGKFPELVVRDSGFDGFNILLFGYPTKFCGEVNDIRRLGEFLDSFLKDELPKYRSVQLVGHSMGGLVIQHALLSIERSRPSLLRETTIEAQAFGTPFYGVEGAGSFGLLCENRQTDDLTVLNKELGRLQKDWVQRFSRYREQFDDKEPFRIALHSFYGIDDHFVREASACGGNLVDCEAVDGDHISIVKPENESHLAYRKVRGLAQDLVRRSSPDSATVKLGAPAQVLTVEGVEDPLSEIPQENQPHPPKVIKFARIRVSNTGLVRVRNVEVVVIKINGSDVRYQLSVSSLDILFKFANAASPKVVTDINPGADEFFDAVVECNGFGYSNCPKGQLAVPFVENGNRHLAMKIEKGVARLEDFTVRVSSDSGGTVTRTFVVSRGMSGHLLLKEKAERAREPGGK